MKKINTAFLLVFLLTVLTACNPINEMEIYTLMKANIDSATSVTTNSVAKVDDYVYMVKSDLVKTPDYQAAMDISINGEPVNLYYSNGKLYQDDSGVKIAMEVPYSQTGDYILNANLDLFTDEEMKNSSYEETAEKNIIVTLQLDEKNPVIQQKLLSTTEKILLGSDMDFENIKYSAVKYTALTNKHGTPMKETLSFTFEAADFANLSDISEHQFELEIEYSAINSIKSVEMPEDLDKYDVISFG